ncbi:hypothetical protein PFL02_42210 [Pseudomonas fluorescens]|nr:hypothetical protein PPC_0421 [Pseudomonas protegens Cab57]GED77371.1 hypothetical protein PFL02_42210 [Pseudomonas fluorescens]
MLSDKSAPRRGAGRRKQTLRACLAGKANQHGPQLHAEREAAWRPGVHYRLGNNRAGSSPFRQREASNSLAALMSGAKKRSFS